jgi:hypothetical protein
MSGTSVVGIDLGYQNSLIAATARGGVDVILNGNSNRLNPYVSPALLCFRWLPVMAMVMAFGVMPCFASLRVDRAC